MAGPKENCWGLVDCRLMPLDHPAVNPQGLVTEQAQVAVLLRAVQSRASPTQQTLEMQLRQERAKLLHVSSPV